MLAAVGLAGLHAETLVALSTLRNCTSVSPSELIVADDPVVGLDPPRRTAVGRGAVLVVGNPEPPLSAAVPAVIVTEGTFFQASEPPLAATSPGRRSRASRSATTAPTTSSAPNTSPSRQRTCSGDLVVGGDPGQGERDPADDRRRHRGGDERCGALDPLVREAEPRDDKSAPR